MIIKLLPERLKLSIFLGNSTLFNLFTTIKLVMSFYLVHRRHEPIVYTKRLNWGQQESHNIFSTPFRFLKEKNTFISSL